MLDEHDPLKHLKDEFLIPLKSHKSHKGLAKGNLTAEETDNNDDSNCVYMNGNSLGCQPKKSKQYVSAVLDDWAKKGLGCHFDGAFIPALYCDELVRSSMGKLVGSENPEQEIVIMNGLTVNLHLMMSSFYRPTGQKTKILLEEFAFPSDHYAVESQIRLAGYENVQDHMILLKAEVNPETGEKMVPTDNIFKIIQEHADEIALILLPGVQYKTGQFFEMEKITKLANQLNIKIGWDLAHAVGNVPVQLTKWGVDFAVWCCYKYVNSGAGAIAGAFLHEKHAKNFNRPRMLGWFGHKLATRFDMDNQFVPEMGALSYRLSNPPPLLVATLKASLEIFDMTSMQELRQKSLLLTRYLETLVTENFSHDELQIITAKDPNQRGAQLSMKCKFANKTIEEVETYLTDAGIFCDSRHDIIRIAPAPLYNSFSDVWEVINAFKFLMHGRGLDTEGQ